MATRIFEFDLPSPSGVDRVQKTIANFPVGGLVLGIFTLPGEARLAVRADPQAPDSPKTLVAVKAGVALTPEEELGTWRGAWMTYRTAQGPEVYHPRRAALAS